MTRNRPCAKATCLWTKSEGQSKPTLLSLAGKGTREGTKPKPKYTIAIHATVNLNLETVQGTLQQHYHVAAL